MISTKQIVNGEIKTVKLGIRKTATSENYFVTIPLTIIQALKWEKGDKLLVQKEGDKVVIEKVQEEEEEKK